LERVVHDLGIELVNRGHEVIVIAAPGSQSNHYKVIHGTGNEYQTFLKLKDMILNQLVDAETVIHDHSWLYAPILLKSLNPKIKLIHTHHGPVFNWKSPPPYPRPCLLGVSRFHAGMLSAEIDRETRFVYHGIDLDHYPLWEQKSDRLIFLNRIDPVKGAHIAIWLAKKHGWKLDIVGGDRLVPSLDYVEKIMSRCGSQIRYWGEVDETTKIRLLQRARVLIAPLAGYEEPFGLYLIEALACGTPVIGLARGSLPEIIENGKVGFLCSGWDDFPRYLEQVDDISPIRCRDYVKQRFSRSRMCKDYEQIYTRVIDGEEW